MLTELRIANFALIDRLNLEFSSGFHVLTGETGAGKSILVDAIAVLIGGRATADLIRSDAEEAILEASFSLSASNPVLEELREQEIVAPAETDVIVRRILSRSGRHRIYLNGNLVPLHTLQRLAGTLVDIHGQHDQQSLLSPKTQLDLLDAFGQCRDLRQRVSRQYTVWRDGQHELEDADRVFHERRTQEDLIRFQCGELLEADLKTGEDGALDSERQRLIHACRLAELGQDAYNALYGDDQSVLAGLALVGERLTVLAGLDPEQSEWPMLCDGIAVQLRELSHRLHAYRQQLDQDPDRLTQVEERLDRIQRLKKKYDTTIEGLLIKADALKEQLEAFASLENRCTELRERVSQDRHALTSLAEELTAGRRQAAERIETRITKELLALRMDQTRVHIQVVPTEDEGLGPTGRDRIEFLFSANPGEPLMPLAKVASGGELSRLMLAIKTVLADTDTVPVLIFDEVDTGIGGAVATVMGQRLRALAGYHQVFCITHLPQIASHATSHLLVEKSMEKKRTVTRVTPLDREARQAEIARMVGGLSITTAVRETAAQMISEADPPPSSAEC
ncbi:MAG: DNA repair protein RecN [Nitrospirota bacterium]|nr:DNA repair protein RecN [Nitrospirota bacterium]